MLTEAITTWPAAVAAAVAVLTAGAVRITAHVTKLRMARDHEAQVTARWVVAAGWATPSPMAELARALEGVPEPLATGGQLIDLTEVEAPGGLAKGDRELPVDWESRRELDR